ncbi:MAG: DUF294 nucleotidyltransferase-like domain-containing protein [Fibrobacterota bacterium]
MRETNRVELHCHSTWSDGALPPEPLAARLAAAGVQFAALTDHDTLEGQRAFHVACGRLGIGCLTGLELTAYVDFKVVHLLGYGLSPDDEELRSILPALHPPPNVVASNFPAQKQLSAVEAIALIHKAGGLTFLAHPFVTEPDWAKLSLLIETLRKAGLDGIETFRSDERAGDHQRLCDTAVSHGLLLSAGTDYHFKESGPSAEPGIDMPRKAWKNFRNAVLAASSRLSGPEVGETLPAPPERSSARIHWKSFARHIVLPAILALSLFAGVLLFAVLPAFERALLDRKREMIRELTNAAWSVLAEAEQEERQGLMTGGEARAQAVKRIEAMRYGRDGKDYFWLQDTTPRMIMHPYRKDLNGSDLSGFTDPRGARIFMLFARLVKEQREGYVNYVWQWKDDPARLEPKESYIRLFKPWGWIIGTGLYTHDVQDELYRLQLRLALFSAGIFALVAFLLVYIMRSSLRIERKRTSTEDLLRETTLRYKTLVDAATEGMLFIRDSRCKYGNPMALELLGYSRSELDFIDITDILPEVEENAVLHALIENLHEKFPDSPNPGVVSRKDGILLECAIMLQSAGPALSEGFLLLLRRTASPDSGKGSASHGLFGKLLKLPASIAQDIREEIDKAATAEEITALCLNAPKLVQSLLDNGASAPEIARMLSSVTDAATRRLLRLGIDAQGEPPVPFAFIALGSQGRMEQTLFTDQDNAIIHSLPQGTDPAATAAYFQTLAGFVCTELTNSGYRHCKGKVMASNPQWCRPLGDWKEYFNNWIQRADLHELMEFSIFFDFRMVYGEESLTRELRSHVLYRVQHSARFFPQAAQNALQFKSPLRLFGIVVSSAGKGESSNQIDLKAASMPLTSFARLYSLQQGIAETNTGARIEELVRKGVLLPSAQEEIVTAYALLLRLRLRQQAAILQAGGQPDNLVDPASLGHIEKAILRECFNEIDVLQARVRRDFLGGE